MRKVKTVEYEGVTGRGERVNLSYDIFDPAHLTEPNDTIFNGAGAPTRGSVPRGTPYLDSVAGDADQFSPSGITTATPPKGESPTD
jgi:hypothetical protein